MENLKISQNDLFPGTIPCKLYGIFKSDDSQKILNEFNEIITMLSNKNKKKGVLDDNEIRQIFIIPEKKKFNCEFYDRGSYYFLILEEEKEEKNDDQLNNFLLNKVNFEFIYKGIEYYCFFVDLMKTVLDLIYSINSFKLLVTKPENNKRKIVYYQKGKLPDSHKFEIKIDYQFKEIEYKKITYKDICKNSEINTGADLNLKLGLYVKLNEKQYNNFKYFNTAQRNKLTTFLEKKMYLYNNFCICGPYGTGKTISLLKLIIENYKINYLYINLQTINKYHINQIKLVLHYELIKLFGFDIFNHTSKTTTINDRFVVTYNDVINLIENFHNKKDIFVFIKNIMKICQKIFLKKIIFIIIDQYSSKYDANNYSIKQLIDNTNNFVHLIICSSMNNYGVKNDLCKSFEEKNVTNDLIYYYVGSLIRLNEIDEFENMVKEESNEFKEYLDYFGYLPLYYYSLNSLEKEKKILDKFIHEEKTNIKEEIKYFYSDDKSKINELSIQMYNDILKILQCINYKTIYFYDELPTKLLIFPLKFLEIKKEEIKLEELELFGKVTNNFKINNFFKELDNEKLNSLKYKNFEMIELMKVDNFCKNYISKISKKKKKI